MKRTPRTPKYSLMTSVKMNTNGHTSTPAVKLRVPSMPNSDQLNGCAPSVASSAKIFTPTNSPISALVRKNPDRKMNSRVARPSMVLMGWCASWVLRSVAAAQATQFAARVFVGSFLGTRREGRGQPRLFGELLAGGTRGVALGVAGLGQWR